MIGVKFRNGKYYDVGVEEVVDRFKNQYTLSNGDKIMGSVNYRGRVTYRYLNKKENVIDSIINDGIVFHPTFYEEWSIFKEKEFKHRIEKSKEDSNEN